MAGHKRAEQVLAAHREPEADRQARERAIDRRAGERGVDKQVE